MNRFIIVDFETTGNHPRQGDQIIQIGAVTVDDGIITNRFASYINPGQAIPPFISSLTGITDEMVASAPTLEEVLPDFLRLLDGRTFVAHNAYFDLSFLQEALISQGYYTFDGYVIDTVELARFLLPTQSGYRLVELADEFAIEHDRPHQADSDAQATAELFIQLLELLERLPLVTLQRLGMLVSSFHSDIAQLLQQIEMNKWSHEPWQEETEERTLEWDIYRQLALYRPQVEQEMEKREPAYSEYELDVFLRQLQSEDGLLKKHQPNYVKREAQDAMIREVYAAFEQETHLLIEAGTGTGKSLAYLLPTILWAKWHEQPVVISTHTIHLQEQLFHKEIPVLKRALPFSFRTALLKGRGNYLCLRKFEQSLSLPAEAANHDVNLTKAQIVTWLTQTETGDVEELSLSPGGMMFWQQVKSDTNSCLHRQCPWFNRCYYFAAKERARQADLIIVNHALLVNDLQSDNRIIPSYQYAIIDEAHQLEEVVSQHAGMHISTVQLTFMLEQLATGNEEELLPQFADELVLWNPSQKDAVHDRMKLVDEQYTKSKEILQQWSQTIYHWAMKRSTDTSEAGRSSVRYKSDSFGKQQKQIVTLSSELVSSFTSLAQTMEQLLQLLKSENQLEPSFLLRSLATNLGGIVSDLAEAAQKIDFLLLSDQDEYVCWMELESRTPRKQVYVFAAPLQVSSLLAERLFNEKRSVILTSATLSVKNSFQYVIDRIGLSLLPEERVRSLALPSPFAYEEQGLILLPTDLPSPGKNTLDEYITSVIKGCTDVIRAAEGRTMILFTSYSMLRSVYDGLKTELDGEEFHLLGHGIDSGNRNKLVRRFQREQKAVLLGTSSFWEGVDIPGEELSCVVIVRLPFQPPNQPLLEGRSERLQENDQNPFTTLSLPYAVIRFKQGVGRLIRQHTDRGVIVVFDSRIVEARYGRAFLNSLPPYQMEKGNWEELRQRIRPFLNGMQSDAVS